MSISVTRPQIAAWRCFRPDDVVRWIEWTAARRIPLQLVVLTALLAIPLTRPVIPPHIASPAAVGAVLAGVIGAWLVHRVVRGPLYR